MKSADAQATENVPEDGPGQNLDNVQDKPPPSKTCGPVGSCSLLKPQQAASALSSIMPLQTRLKKHKILQII